MVRDFQKQFNRLHILINTAMISGSYLLAWYILSGLYHEKVGRLSFTTYAQALFFIVPLYLLLDTLFGLYAPRRTEGRRAKFAGILKADAIGALLFTLVLYLGSKNVILYHFSCRLVLVFYLTCVVWTTIERNVIRSLLRRMQRLGFNQKNTLLAGYDETAKGCIDHILTNAEWGCQINDILDDTHESGLSYHSIRIIGAANELQPLLERNALDKTTIILSLLQYERLKNIVPICGKPGVHTKFIPDHYGVIPIISHMEDVVGMPVINIRHVPLTESYNTTVKHLVDIVGGIVRLVVSSPVMLPVAILVKTSSPGSIILRQERVDLYQEEFWMYKSHSIRQQVGSGEKKGWIIKKDPRVVWIGRILKEISLDGTPQLFNIVHGDMSPVGPRSECPYFAEKFKEEVPYYMIEHQVKPGLTGRAQINGLRGDTLIQKRTECDLYCIENWTLGFDFRIIPLIFVHGFTNKNVY